MGNGYDSVKSSVKNWWLSLIIGIMCVAIGIMCFLAPEATFLTLTVFFIAAFFVSGIFEITFAITNRNYHDGWGWALTIGIIDIIFGIILLASPAMAPTILTYFIAFWLMFQSFWSIGTSIDMRKYENSGWGLLLAVSIIGLILSIVLLFEPIITGILAITVTATIFIIYGIFRIMLAFRLKSFGKYIK